MFLFPTELGKAERISQAFGERLCSFCAKPIEAPHWKNCSTLCTKRKNYTQHVNTSRFLNNIGYQETQTGIGTKWEKWFAEKFNGIWANEEVMGQPYDVEWNGKKIDVKACEYYVRKNKRGKPWHGGGCWIFNPTVYIKPEIDYYALVALKNDKPVKCLLVPADIFHLRKGLTIGRKSQFDIYNIL